MCRDGWKVRVILLSQSNTRRSVVKRSLPILLAFFLATAARGDLDSELLAGIEARSIGPAAMSGRIAAIDAVESNPEVIYVGAASGGVWKSINAGLTWNAIFDDQEVHSIGALAIFQASPDIVWVGTGEGNPRNSVSVGRGIYRSLDGGKTWKHLGLEKTERIHRIVLHPQNPDIAYVAALGQMWGENPERGVFKTTDGGRTWHKVLYHDEKTGAADLIMDPQNPDKLIAALWQYRRWPWFFESGGPGSGLYLSYDGGATWKKLGERQGLPKGELGRIGLALCHRQPQIVYALVEAEESALLRSEDGGESWRTVNRDPQVARRPFYFADLRVDPEQPNRIYSLESLVRVSDSGGESFKPLVKFPPVHPDHHALWIHPQNPRLLLLGNDGGVAISRDHGTTWRFVANLPVAQFYHVAVDQATPYNVYGGLQDNGSWRGPSTVWQTGGIRNHHWQLVSFGDGFDTRPDREQPDLGYSMSQEGYVVRWNLRTGEEVSIRPPRPAGGDELRFNWNAAIALDPFDPATIYYGSQYVHRSHDRGETWGLISPDLTSNRQDWQRQDESGGLTVDATGAENYTTILAIVPSPIERGVLWVGTDDGRLHVTRDHGKSWTSVEEKVPGVPSGTWIPHIEASHHDGGTAFVVFDDHRRSNWTPYAYKTEDYGQTWKSLIPQSEKDRPWGYVLCLVQDVVDPDLLFLGTEFGLYVSLDGGDQWLPWRHGLPTASVMDLAIQPREHDLVIATHGRSLYVLDDLSFLRELDAETFERPLHLFTVAKAQQYRSLRTQGELAPGDGEFAGENRPYGALITYSLKADDLPRHGDSEGAEVKSPPPARRTGPCTPKETDEGDEPKTVEIHVYRGEEKIRTFNGPAKLGLNRAVWDLRRDPFREFQQEPAWWYGEPQGPEVPPGQYEIELRFRDQEARGTVVVEQDPRSSYTPEEMQIRWSAILRAGELQSLVTRAVERIDQTRCTVELLRRRIEDLEKDPRANGGEEPFLDLKAAANELEKALFELENLLRIPPENPGIAAAKDALSKILYAKERLLLSWSAPNASDLSYLFAAEEQLRDTLEKHHRFFSEEVRSFVDQVEASGLELFPPLSPLSLDAP